MATVPSRPSGRQGRDPSSGPPESLAPLDTSDRAALAAWLFAVWRAVQTVIAIATNATRPAVPSLRIPDDIAGNVAADASTQLDALFARVRPLLTEGGVVLSWEPGVATPEEMARHDVIIRARWDAEQAKLPPAQRRTLEQAEADDEAHVGRQLRRGRDRGEL